MKTSTLSGTRFFKVKSRHRFLFLICALLLGSVNVSAQVPCGSNTLYTVTQAAYGWATVDVGFNFASSGYSVIGGSTSCWDCWNANVVGSPGQGGSAAINYWVVVNSTAKTITWTTTAPDCGAQIQIDPTTLSGFSACNTASGQSASQRVTVTGSGLGGTIAVSGVAAYQYSVNSGAWTAAGAATTMPAAGGTLDVRIAPSQTTGAKTGTITLSATGATSKTVTLNGTVASTASMTVNSSSITATEFDYASGGTPPVQSFTVSGTCLTGTTTVTAPAGFQVSTTSSTAGFSATAGSVTLPAEGGTVWVRLAPGGAKGAYSGNVSVANASVATQNVPVSGTITGATLYFAASSGNDWGTLANWKTGSCSGSTAAALPTQYDNVVICNDKTLNVNISNAVCYNVLHGDQNSPTLTMADGSALTIYGDLQYNRGTDGGGITMNGTSSMTVMGNVLYAKNNGKVFTIGASATVTVYGNFTIENRDAKVTVNGILDVRGNLTDNHTNSNGLGGTGTIKVGGNFIYTANNTWQNGNFTLEMTGCGQTIDINRALSVATFRQSASCATKYTKTNTNALSFTTYDQNCNPVNLAGNANSPQNGWIAGFNGTSANTTGWAARINSSCTPTITKTGTLTAFSTCPTAASASQSFSVSAVLLTNPLVVGPLAGYEFCLTSGGTYTTSLSIPHSSGTVDATTIYVRLKSGNAAGSYNGNIPAASSPATTQNVAATGSVVAGAIITPSVTSLGSFVGYTDCNASVPKSFTVDGSCLSGNISVTLPASVDYEISSSATGPWVDALSVAAGATVYVQVKESGTATTVAASTVTLTNNGTTATVNLTGGTRGAYTTKTFYFNASSNNNWGTLANWTTGSCGGTAATALPTACDNVIICNDKTLNVDVANAVCKDLGHQNNPTLTIANGSGLTIYGNLNYSAGTDGGGITLNGTSSMTVMGNAAYSKNNYKDFNIGASATVTVYGNFTIDNRDSHVTVNGTLDVRGNLTDNHTNTSGLRGSGTVMIGGNFIYTGAGWNGSNLTLEMTGCGQNFNINKNLAVATFRQSATCATKYTTTTATNLLTFTTYDQNCNSVALAGNAAQTGWAAGFNGAANNTLRWDECATETPGCSGRIKADCNTPRITVTGTVPAMTTCVNTAGTPETFTVKGKNLTNNLVVGPLTGYEFATSAGGAYSSSLTFTPVTGTVAEQTIYVRLASSASAATFAAATIPVTSTGAAAQSAAIGAGSVTAASYTAIPEVVFDPVCDGDPYGRKPFTLNGTCISGTITMTPQTDYSIYAASAGGAALTGAGLTVTPTAGVINQTYYLARTATASFTSQNAVTFSSGFATVKASGTASTNLTGSSTGALDFGSVCDGSSFSTLQPFTVKGTCVATGGVGVSVPAGFAIFTDVAGTTPFVSPVSKTDALAGKVLYLKRTANSAFNAPTITLTNGSVIQTIDAKGTIKTPALTPSASTVSLSYLWAEGAGGPDNQSFNITTECFTCPITLALSGTDADKFEITTNGNFASPTTTLPQTGGTVSVRFIAGQDIDTYDAAITVTTGAPCNTTAIIALTGEVTYQPRNFYYTGTGDWTTAANWYKSCGNTSAGNQWNAVPNDHDNVTLCASANVTITSNVTRIGTFTITHTKTNPVQLTIGADDIGGTLNMPAGFAVNAGQITIKPLGMLNVDGNFTFQSSNGGYTTSTTEIFIDNQGTINVRDGKFQMNATSGSYRYNEAAYFNNAGNFNLTNSDFIINAGLGVFFYNENGGKILVDNLPGSSKKVQIHAMIGLDHNCVYGVGNTIPKYCGNNGLLWDTNAGGDNCTTLKAGMWAQFAENQIRPSGQVTGGEHSYVFFNGGSTFTVINSDVGLQSTDNARTSTLGGKITVQDGNLSTSLSGGGGLRLRLQRGAAIHVYSTVEGNGKGILKVNGSGGGSQIFAEEGAEVFAQGFDGSSAGGCSALNFEPGSVGFIGEMAATVTTSSFQVHVLGTLYYCGNKSHPVGDKVGYVFAGGKLYYASDKYFGTEPDPITNIGGGEDFNYTKFGANPTDILQIQWATTAACQAAFMDSVTGNTWLPVELVEFTAELKGASVVLGWSTLSETNNDYFTVQRSGDGVAFHCIAEILGAGTTVIPQYYGYVDENPLAGVSYYRLKQTDFNGEYSHSHVVPVYVQNSVGNACEVSKTTTNGITRLECKFADTASNNHVSIHTVTGKLLFETTVAPHNATFVVELPLPSGVYLVSNVSNGGKTVVRVLVTN